MNLICKTQEPVKLTTWNKEPKWHDLNEDYTNARASHEIFLKDLNEYRTTLLGGPKVKVRKGKSKVRPLLVRKNNEWKYSQLEEPFLSTPNMVKLNPKSPEDAKTYRQAEQLINYYWSVDIDKIALVGNIARCVTDEGTVIVKNGWYTEKETYCETVMDPIYATAEESLQLIDHMVKNGQMSPEEAQARLESGTPMVIGEQPRKIEKTRLIKNHPIHDVCELEHIIVDPTCKGNLNKAQFIIHEYDVNYATLVKDKFNPETGVGYYKNLDAIDFRNDWEKQDEYTSERESTFIFSDKARKKVRIVEYWGNWDVDGTGKTTPIVASWIDDVLIRLEENPFPHKKLPFSATTYMPVRNQFHGQPDAALLKENQESIGKMTRAYHDITTTKAIGQKLIMEDTFGSQSEWSAYEAGNDARYRNGVDINRAIHQANVESVDPAVFQVIQMQQQDAESLTGNTLYNKGLAGNSSTAGSATGIRTATDSAGRRELSILRRMSSQLFRDMIRQDIANMQAFASPEEVVRVTNEEYVTIRLEDIQGEYDLDIDVSTPAKDQETAETLSFILQAAGDTIDPTIKNMVLGDILRLKQRPDLAKRIEEYQPQPSEAQTKMEAMQMENAELENKLLRMKIAEMGKGIEEADSRIEERASRAAENIQADIALKTAKAEEHLARKEYYESQADVMDIKFLHEHDGTARQRQINDMSFKEDSKREIEELKSRTALANKVQGEE